MNNFIRTCVNLGCSNLNTFEDSRLPDHGTSSSHEVWRRKNCEILNERVNVKQLHTAAAIMWTHNHADDKQRLFILFAQTRRKHLARNLSADVNHDSSFQPDWSDFCNDTCRGSNDLLHISVWQRLSKLIIKQDSLKVLRASTPSSSLFFDGHFKGFSVGMALTMRALKIKGVNPAQIAKAQWSLQMLQKDRLGVTTPRPATKSLSHSKHHRLDLVATTQRS